MQGNRKQEVSKIVLNDPECVIVDNGKKSIAYFCKWRPVKVDKKLMDELKKIASESGDRNVRLCLHDSPNANFHDMIILEKKGKYCPPHKHLTKGESFQIIEGSMAIFSFDDDSNVIDFCILDPNSSFIYRVGVNMYHSVMPLSDLVIYHEARPGPFLGSKDSIYPAWAPNVDNPKEMVEFNKKLLNILGLKQ